MKQCNDNNRQLLPQTGQITCHNDAGLQIACADSGQDGALRRGQPWPEPRFEGLGELVRDRLTNLIWTKSANLAEFPLDWQESLDFVADMNRARRFGFNDWRLPNRREMRSLISHQTRLPALPDGHPYNDVFTHWYWTSTTAAPANDHAWYVNLDGGRLFFGGKDQSFMLWPVRGRANRTIARTGQSRCYDRDGRLIPCENSGQDGAYRSGVVWPEPRFVANGSGVLDCLTGCRWSRCADLADGPVSWREAFAVVSDLRNSSGHSGWRLPNINELESLVDCAYTSPALSPDLPFIEVRDIYWSSTTSRYEPDWAWALYLDKGAVGVGQKQFALFHVWAVSS